MGLQTRQVDEEGFKATIHTLTCEQTGKQLAEIVVKQENEDIVAIVEATSPFAQGASSGKHKITGVLAFGGVDSPRFPTLVKNIEFDETDDGLYAKLEVING